MLSNNPFCAVHEAGHAVAARAFNFDVTDVSLEPPSATGPDGRLLVNHPFLNNGKVKSLPPGATERDVEYLCICLLAGPTAEIAATTSHNVTCLLVMGDKKDGTASNDLTMTTQLFEHASWPAERWEYTIRKTVDLVSEKWASITSVRDALQEKRRLTSEQIDRLIAESESSQSIPPRTSESTRVAVRRIVDLYHSAIPYTEQRLRLQNEPIQTI